ncbi:hypothetical protein AALP_AAs54771U000100 [Arabis alpina]|uniref:Uncharacterized protein n=1 Tax=Arabis alpina TaxID=50452 RepID=A0A087FYU3_ARAAL|nr:hypothetical protein AALP_AAs54771U000100 [Arabis alpina]
MEEDPKSASIDILTTADVPLTSGSTLMGENPKSTPSRDDGLTTLHDDPIETFQMTSGATVATTSCSVPDVVMTTLMSDEDPRRLVGLGDPNTSDGSSFVILLNDEDPELPFGIAFASSSSSLSGSRASSDESDDEDMFVEVEQTKKAKKVKKKAKRFVVLSREYGVVISAEHLSYLTDFRVRGRSEELKHTVTNSSGMALIAGLPSKDDHFGDRFFFVEISERTVDADCIDLVKTRWERRVKSSFPEVSEEFVTAMHTELSSGNGNWSKSFRRKRIERALSAEIFPGKILGRGLARMSFCEQAALEVAVKVKRPRVVAPMTSSPTALLVRARPSRPSASKTFLHPPSPGELAEFRRLSAERAHISSGKGKGIDRETPSKRQRVDTFPAAVIGRETSARPCRWAAS